jgi:hypothetical protein
MAAPVYRGGRPFFGAPLRQKQDIIASSSASVTIKPSQSGAVFLLDRATLTYALPAPKIGLWYEFVVTVAAVAQKIISDAVTSLYIGSIWETVAAGTGTQFFPNGSSNRAINMAGTTTGGLVNTTFILQCVSLTQWLVDGTNMASGTIATPFGDS